MPIDTRSRTRLLCLEIVVLFELHLETQFIELAYYLRSRPGGMAELPGRGFEVAIHERRQNMLVLQFGP